MTQIEKATQWYNDQGIKAFITKHEDGIETLSIRMGSFDIVVSDNEIEYRARLYDMDNQPVYTTTYNEFLFTMLLKDTTHLGGLPYDELWDIGRRLYDVYMSSEESNKLSSDYVCMTEWISVNKTIIKDIIND